MSLLWSATAEAETIRLKSGKTLEGTVIFRNEEVVVFRDANGKRFQYPMSDVEVILTDEEAAELRAKQAKNADSDEEKLNVQAYKAPKVSILLGAYGGGLVMPAHTPAETPAPPSLGPQLGGSFGADFNIGSYSMLGRKIFLGGGLGYHGVTLNGKTLSFLPVQLRAEVPLMQTKHAPLLGLSVGYGIGLNGVKGGVYSSLLFGWKASFGRKGGFFLGITGDVQGARLTVTEVIEDKTYRSEVQRVLVGFGVRMGLYF